MLQGEAVRVRRREDDLSAPDTANVRDFVVILLHTRNSAITSHVHVSKYHDCGKIGYPTGEVERWETPQEAAVRVVKTETGINICESELLAVTSNRRYLAANIRVEVPHFYILKLPQEWTLRRDLSLIHI